MPYGRVTGKELWSAKTNEVFQGDNTIQGHKGVLLRRQEERRIVDNFGKIFIVSTNFYTR